MPRVIVKLWLSIGLGRLLEGELEPHTSLDPEQIVLDGQVVVLNSTTALSLGLVFHELATNAAKYGALSAETGRFKVRWELTGEGETGTISIDWIESGGPVVRTPCRKGFGSRLIEDSVTGRRGGTGRPILRATVCVAAWSSRCRVRRKYGRADLAAGRGPWSARVRPGASSAAEAKSERQAAWPVVPAAAEIPAATVVPGVMAGVPPRTAVVPTLARRRRPAVVAPRRPL